MPNKKRKVKEENDDDYAPTASATATPPPPTLALEDMLPSHTRKTKNGGYAHTNLSKQRIGQANAGNTPWNKGKIRSSADKAKIAAGVRARNRTLLLEKLQRLGMTEEEYEEKKKQIKYLRERIRRAKIVNTKHKDAETKLRVAEAERRLKAVLDSTTEKEPPIVIHSAAGNPKESDAKRIIKATTAIAQKVFTKELIWTPYRWSNNDADDEKNDTITKDDKNDNTTDDSSSYPPCPIGGPGGLICCSDCAKQYTLYLSSTMQDMEVQRWHRTGKEVQELLGFLQNSQEALENAYETAKRKVPPLPLILASTNNNNNTTGTKEQEDTTVTKDSSATENKNESATAMEWSATSAMDIAASEAAQVGV